MVLPFHTIWLGGCLPLRALENLIHLQRLGPSSTMPVLWFDRAAWEATRLQAALPMRPCDADPSLLPAATPRFGLRIGREWAGPAVTVLLVEDLTAVLAEPWQRLDPAREALRGLADSPDGDRFLRQELGLDEPAAAALIDGAQLFPYLHTLFEHARHQWARHGLLCLASDLLRLFALAWLPGAYGDLGDVAGRLRSLPVASDAEPHGFCAHHTVAIENDLILATHRTTLQAITMATALWSWRSVHGIANRLGILQPHLSPEKTLRAVLPHLDQRLPPPPPLLPLLQPPWTRLADVINLAYGARPLFHPPAQLASYSAGRRGKELLINQVGGFTGYQKAAHHLVPDNAHRWARLAEAQHLQSYAPQLGWRTYGFGTLDGLIDLGGRLSSHGTPAAPGETAQAEAARLAEGLGLSEARLRAIAVLAHSLHGLLRRAHGEAQQRSLCLAKVERLCQRFDAPG